MTTHFVINFIKALPHFEYVFSYYSKSFEQLRKWSTKIPLSSKSSLTTLWSKLFWLSSHLPSLSLLPKRSFFLQCPFETRYLVLINQVHMLYNKKSVRSWSFFLLSIRCVVNIVHTILRLVQMKTFILLVFRSRTLLHFEVFTWTFKHQCKKLYKL